LQVEISWFSSQVLELKIFSSNEYIKWPSGVLLLIKSCHSCTYSMRAIFRFLSWKSCHKSSRFWDEISQISSMRALLRFFSLKLCHKSSRFWDEIFSILRLVVWELYWAFFHENHVIKVPNFGTRFLFDLDGSTSAPLEFPKFAWHHHQSLDTYLYDFILKYFWRENSKIV